MSTIDLESERERALARVLKKKFAKMVIEARTADVQWLTEEMNRQLERRELQQAGLLAQPTAELLQFPQSPEPGESE